jgi:hypothetical protein
VTAVFEQIHSADTSLDPAGIVDVISTRRRVRPQERHDLLDAPHRSSPSRTDRRRTRIECFAMPRNVSIAATARNGREHFRRGRVGR